MEWPLVLKTGFGNVFATGRWDSIRAQLIAEACNPLGSAGQGMQTPAPTVADPLVALRENRDWTGAPIARQDFNSLAPTPGHARAKGSATPWAKAISRAVNWATGGTEYKPGGFSPTPDQVDYLFGQIGGGLAREVSKTAQTVEALATGEELAPHKIPLAGRFYGSGTGQAQESTKFYDNIIRLNEHQAEIKGRRAAGEGGTVWEYLADNPEARMVAAAERRGWRAGIRFVGQET